uniref:flagellar basal body protein n=1 Tax=Enterocloster clostridioformis TaxID=1531 RepID=UPI003078F771
MLRAMDSAVAGLRSHQNKLDVIGNNIANVNTLGFKAQSYSFKYEDRCRYPGLGQTAQIW